MGEHHHHHHHHEIQLDELNSRLILGIILNVVFVVVEVLAGLWYQSLALLSDAGHNLSDVITLVLALVSFKLLAIVPNKVYTYGYRKATILAALFNGILLLGAIFWIAVESIQRLQTVVEVDGFTTMIVATIGILINGLTTWLFLRDKESDLNIKGAYLHMLADTLVSAGVVIGGLIIYWTNWYWVDTVMSLLIVLLLIRSTWALLVDSFKLSLDACPKEIELDQVKAELLRAEEVLEVHHVHIWALSTMENALTAHIVVTKDLKIEDWAALKGRLKHQLEHLQIQHSTLELEQEIESCSDRICRINTKKEHHHHHH